MFKADGHLDMQVVEQQLHADQVDREGWTAMLRHLLECSDCRAGVGAMEPRQSIFGSSSLRPQGELIGSGDQNGSLIEFLTTVDRVASEMAGSRWHPDVLTLEYYFNTGFVNDQPKLTEASVRRVRMHLDHCPDCREALSKFEILRPSNVEA